MQLTYEDKVTRRVKKDAKKTFTQLAKEARLPYVYMAKSLRNDQLSPEYEQAIEKVLKEWGV